MSSGQGALYFLKKGDGAIYGPTDLDALKAWAREGRVAPDDLVSKDKEFWYPAPTLTDLEMNWSVHLSDGTQYGPIHLQALWELAEEGSLSADDLVTNRITEQVSTLREAMAALSLPEQAAKPAELEPAPQPSLAAEEIPASPAPPQPAMPAAAIAAQPEPLSPRETAPTPQEKPQPASWRDLAARKDSLERELAKWRTMFEQEHKRFLDTTRELEERIQALKKSELAALTRAEQCERKLRQSEENYRLLRESLSSDPSRPHSHQLMALTELHRDLSQRYDDLSQLLQEKNAEIDALLKSRAQAEARVDEQIQHMREIVERERQEADQARRRSLKIEEDYVQLVKAYRDLNEKYMQLRQGKNPGPAAPATQHASQKRK